MNARSLVVSTVVLGAVVSLTLAACKGPLGLGGPSAFPGGHGGQGTLDGGPGNSDGGICTFSTEQYYPALTSGLVLTALSTGDLNLDGHPDVVAAGGTSLVVWRGLLDGGLGTATEYVTLGSSAAVQVADFNFDGTPDISVLDREQQNASQLFPGYGDGGLGAPQQGPGFPYITQAATGDFDQDGNLDWAVATNNSDLNGDVALLLSPDGGSGIFSESINLDNNRLRAGIAVGDVTHDGIPDLVTTDPNNAVATVFAGYGDGGFLESISPVSTGAGPGAVAIADLNQDGLSDAVIAAPFDRSLYVLTQSDGGLTPGIQVASAGGYPQALVAGPWPGGGTANGVITAEVNPPLLGFLVQDAGTLVVVGSLTPSSNPAALSLMDVNGDGALDVVSLLDGGVAVYPAVCP